MDLEKKAQGLKVRGIVGIVLIFTLIGAIVSLIFAIMDSITILTTDWKNEELNNSKTLWGILGLLILGNIATLIFGINALKAYKGN